VRDAAVVVPVVFRTQPSLVFVRRAAHLRRNPGDIGFPGGLMDATDDDARAAALREFEEELGISRDRVQIFERLPDVVTLALSVTIAPFVGHVDAPATFAFEAAETESVHEIPIANLYAPGALHEGIERVRRDETTYEVRSWLFDRPGVHVWGATARILRELTLRFDERGLVARATRAAERGRLIGQATRAADSGSRIG